MMMKTIDEILREGNLDFEVLKKKMYCTFSETATEVERYIGSKYYGLVNSKTEEVLHVVSKGYHPSQNRDLLEQVMEGIKPFQKEVILRRAVSIDGGRKVFIQLKVIGESVIDNKGKLTKYITITDSNDGSTGVVVGIGNKDSFCDNQFYAFNKAGKIRIRHSAKLKKRMLDIPAMIEEALEENMRVIRRFHNLASTPTSKMLAHQLVEQVLGFSALTSKEEIDERKIGTRRINDMKTLYQNIDKEMSNRGDNLWAMFSGVTRFTTHTIAPRNTRKENGDLASMVAGRAHRLNNRALNFLELQTL